MTRRAWTDAAPRRRPRYATRYEVAAWQAGDRDGPAWPFPAPAGAGRYVVGFTERTSRRGLLDAMRARGDELVELLELTDADELTWHARPRAWADMGRGGWVVGFTGWTELQRFHELGRASGAAIVPSLT